MGFGGIGGMGGGKGGWGQAQPQNVQGWGRPQAPMSQADQSAFQSGINSLFGINASVGQPSQAPGPVPEAANTIQTESAFQAPVAPQTTAQQPMDFFNSMSPQGRQQMMSMFQPSRRGGVTYGQGVNGGIMATQQAGQFNPANNFATGIASWTPQAQAPYQSDANLSPVTAQQPYTPPPQDVASPYQQPASPAQAGGGSSWTPNDAKRGIMPPESMRATNPTGYHVAMLAARRRQGGSQGGGDRGSH